MYLLFRIVFLGILVKKILICFICLIKISKSLIFIKQNKYDL